MMSEVTLKHRRSRPLPPARVVVLGGQGFIGGAIVERLRRAGAPVNSLGRSDVDLLADGATEKLVAILRPDDALVFVSARAPCKTAAMLMDNVRMADAVVQALSQRPVDHVVCISSDAVYADGPVPLTEFTPAAPTSLHGAMHLVRELLLAAAVQPQQLAILRPTLVYGPKDPHNGYGPNRFRRQANKGEPIVLFGLGEERRDHVHVEDVAEIVWLVLQYSSFGILNVATGEVASFREVADAVVKAAGKPIMIGTTSRTSPMPHNGYRPFDARSTLTAFPGFRYMPLELGIGRAQAAEFPKNMAADR